MHYVAGKSKLHKLGRYPAMTLDAARQAALEFQRDPKSHLEKRTTPDTFEGVVTQFLKLYVDKKKLRTGKVIKQRIDEQSSGRTGKQRYYGRPVKQILQLPDDRAGE